MNDTNTYGTIINEKLNEFSFPDMNSTWPGMKAILDKEMPEKRRRGFLFWVNISSMTAFIVGTSLVYLAVHYYTKNHTTQITQNNTVTSFNKITKSTDFKTASPITTNTVSANAKQEQNNSENRVSDNQKLITVVTGPAKNKQAEIESSTSSKPGSLSTVQSFEKKSMNSKELPKQPAVVETVFSMAVNRANNFKEQSKNIGKEDIVNEESRNITSLQKNIWVKSVSVNRATDSLIKEITTGIAEKKKANFTNPIIDSVQTKSLPVNDTLSSKKAKPSAKNKGWVAGASINYNLPVSNQEMSTVSINGKKNTLIDFLPSLYVQYHFNKQWFIESGFQFSSPQYISNHKLSSQVSMVNANKKQENAIWLNKLYYLNVPASIHFQPLPSLTIGTGIQYAYLKRSIFEDEQATWEKQAGGKWTKTASSKTVKVTNGNGDVKSNNGRGGGPGGTPTTPTPTVVDTVAHTLRNSDWRLLFDVNYRWRRINLGCSFNYGLKNYINTTSGNTILPVKDRNEALQFYLRYAIFDRRKK